MKRVHLIFYGNVQGVFFRQKTFDKANALRVNGWVRNLSNGSVECVFEGENSKVDELLNYCKTIGKVIDVKIKEEKPENIKGFKISK